MSEMTGFDSVANRPASGEVSDGRVMDGELAIAPLPSTAYREGTASLSPQQQVASVRRLMLTGAEKFWYVLQCIAFGAGYFAKVPTRKALSPFSE